MAADEQTSTPGEQPSDDFTMVPIRRRRMFGGSDRLDEPGRRDRWDEVDPFGSGQDDDDAEPTAGRTEDAAADSERDSAGSADDPAASTADGDFYLPRTTPAYLSISEDERVSRQASAATLTEDDDDQADYRPARMVRTAPGWEISKWFVVTAIAMVFVLAAFLVIPAIFEPEKAASDGTAAAATTTEAAPTTVVRPAYRDVIMQSGPAHYWRFAPGALEADEVGTAPLTIGDRVTYLGSTAVYGGTGAVDCAGTNRSLIATTSAMPPMQDYSVELWFSAATKEGGQLVGFNTRGDGIGGSDDRVVYMDRDGFINVGVVSGGKRYAVRSDKSYNNGSWHQVVVTKAGEALLLYIDGAQVGSVKVSGTFSVIKEGYWRMCGGPVGGWPRNGGTPQWAGSLDDVAVYPAALAPDQVTAHYNAGI